MHRDWPRQLAQGLEAMDLAATGEQQRLLLAYLGLLQKWNRAFNLTAVRDPRVMVSRQLLDSLSIQRWLSGPRVLDVGSGAGLPGIPLAILNPDHAFVLLDTNSKKTRFLRQVWLELKLGNVEVEQARVEQFQPSEPFQCIVSRAFAPLPKIVALTGHLLAADGRWLAMKGRVPESELAGLAAPHDVQTYPLQVPGEGAARHLVLIQR